jgi:urease accessory protein
MKARWLLTALTVALPALVSAHPGHEMTAGFADGLSHPWLGLDHVAAMLAVGLWAAQLQGRSSWLLPTGFITAMLLGAVLSMSGIGVSAVEQGIVASVIVLGLLVASAMRLPTSVCLTLTSGFALFHGYAHGAEAPVQTNMSLYMSGFALSTVVLLGLGFVLARLILRQAAVRWFGAALAVSGLALLAV